MKLGRGWSSCGGGDEEDGGQGFGEEKKEKDEVKKEMKCKGKVFIGFGFYEGDANKIEERGVFAKWRRG